MKHNMFNLRLFLSLFYSIVWCGVVRCYYNRAECLKPFLQLVTSTVDKEASLIALFI